MNTKLIPLAGALALAAAGAPASAPAREATLDAPAAQAIVDSFYGALTASTPADVERRLTAIVDPAWRNCADNDACQDLPATIRRWSARITTVPDLAWRRMAVVVAGDRLVLRGEASGTPRAPFLGLAPSGRAFRVMTIDIHTVRDGRIVETLHLEDWASALRQLAPAPAASTASTAAR